VSDSATATAPAPSPAADAAAGHTDLQGPSATGGDRIRFWQLLWITSRTEFRLRYHGSVLGWAWSLLHPLLLFGVIYLFFTQVLRFGGTIPHYNSMLLLNIMLFGFFSEATNQSVTALVSRERMLRTTEFPRIVIPVSGAVTSMFALVVGLPVAFLFMLLDGVDPAWTWLLTPVLVALLFAVTLAFSLVLSTLYVTVRDTAMIWGVAARALFYASPIIYVMSFVPISWRPLAYANPLAPILTQARHWLIDPNTPNAWEAGGTYGFLPALIVALAIGGIGTYLFVTRASRIAELL